MKNLFIMLLLSITFNVLSQTKERKTVFHDGSYLYNKMIEMAEADVISKHFNEKLPSEVERNAYISNLLSAIQYNDITFETKYYCKEEDKVKKYIPYNKLASIIRESYRNYYIEKIKYDNKRNEYLIVIYPLRELIPSLRY